MSEAPTAVENWLESVTVGNEGRRLNMTQPCADIVDSIDRHCSFNISEVQEFTKRVQANGGDMTLAFWVKPVNELSLIKSRFFPQLTFFSSLHPPQHVINLGIFFNPNGEVRLGSKCRPSTSRWPFENIEMKRASEAGWTFLAVTVDQTSVSSQTRTTVFTNLGRNRELAAFPVCLFDQKALFQAIEVN